MHKFNYLNGKIIRKEQRIGGIVKLNSEFLKVYFKGDRKYLKEEVWKERLKVIDVIDNFIDKYIVRFESKNFGYNLYIMVN